MTDTLVIDIDILEFTLGEKQFQIPAAGLRRSEEWRKLFEAELQEWLRLVQEEGGVILPDMDHLKDLADVDVMKLLPVVGQLLTRLNVSMNRLGELIVAYSPHLEAEKDHIFEYATSKQAIYTLYLFARQEYPFFWIGQITGMATGQADDTTKSNSRSRGASRRKK